MSSEDRAPAASSTGWFRERFADAALDYPVPARANRLDFMLGALTLVSIILLALSGSVLTLYAQYVAELMVETLKRAEEPLTRASLVAAAESIKDWQCSVCLFPLTLGPDDHDPAQGVAIAKYQGGQVVITDMAYSWEGVQVADLSLDSLKKLDVPADALTPPQ